MSEQVERRLLDVLGSPTESPYGTPIPGLDELGLEPASSFLDGVERATGVTGTYTVRRLGEPIQFDIEVLGELQEAGLVPGAVVEIAGEGRSRTITIAGGGAIDLPTELAQHVYVAQAAEGAASSAA